MRRITAAELAELATRTIEDPKCTIDVELHNGEWLVLRRRDELENTMPGWVKQWIRQNSND